MTVFFDFYLACIAAATINLLTTGSLLLVVRKARLWKANLVLGVLLLCLAITYGTDLLYENNFYERYPALLHWEVFLTLAIGPLLYFYIKYQTRPDFRQGLIQLLHLVPLAIYFLILFDLFTNPSVKETFLQDKDLSKIPYFGVAIYFRQVQLLFYLVCCYRLLARHNRVIQQLASSIENKRLKWLKDFLLVATVLYVAGFLANEVNWVNYAVCVLLLLFSGWIAYYAIRQEYVFGSLVIEAVLPIIEDEPVVRYRNSRLTPEDKQRFMQQIEQHMSNQKSYLDSELTLPAFAQQLQLNPNLLSQVLNEGFEENFYRFMNRYRVEESKRLLLDPAYKHYTILAIALQAGFSSKSTFNRTFKEIAGCAPSEFSKQHP
jgi:AraC-like DNA-binding protein